jgi:hypothetical protein
MKIHRFFNLTLTAGFLLVASLWLAACDSSTVLPTQVVGFTADQPTQAVVIAATTHVTSTSLPLATVTPAPNPTQVMPPAPTPTELASITSQDTTSVATTVIVSSSNTPTPKAGSAGQVSPVFQSVLAALKRQKEVVAVLPTYIPGTEDGTVYAVIERSDAPGYSIILGYTPDCTGGTACRIGTVAGRPAQTGVNLLRGTGVKLDKNIKGYFTDSSCGANCSDATISWKQGKGVYTVGIKAGKLDELTKMANSAINAGPLQ